VSTGDLADAERHPSWFARRATAFGSVDAIVHARGFGSARFCAIARARASSGHSCHGTAFTIGERLRSGSDAGPHGRVVAISSFVAHRFTREATYPACRGAKAALEALVRCLAIELAARRDGQCRSCRLYAQGCRRMEGVGPRELAIGARPSARTMAEPDHSGPVVAFLLSPEAGHMRGRVAGRWRLDSDVVFCGGGSRSGDRSNS